jgi:UDP-N-acetylglucosamine 2-epimerase (non-hydrolysing)
MKKVFCVMGTRPEAIKMAPVIHAFQRLGEVRLWCIWSGQHYDRNMSTLFFEELDLPTPDFDLKVGSGSHSDQTSRVMTGVESLAKSERPDIIIAQGDTNTVLSAGLAAIKSGIPFGHVEAGLRSYDRTMPEEINRCIASVCAQLNFAPTPNSAINLLYEGVPPSRIFVTGNTIVDAVEYVLGKHPHNKGPAIIPSKGRNLAVLTLHRAETTDNRNKLENVFKALSKIEAEIVFPMHPRTRARLASYGLLKRAGSYSNVKAIPPVGYSDFIQLVKSADLVLTDSGGVQEECFILGTPVLTLRSNTERPETVWEGENRLTGTDRKVIVERANNLLRRKKTKRITRSSRAFGDGRAGERIARIVLERLEQGTTIDSPVYLESASAVHELIYSQKSSATVKEIRTVSSPAIVTLVYTADGSPVFPYDELAVSKGEAVRVFGPRRSLSRARLFLSESGRN